MHLVTKNLEFPVSSYVVRLTYYSMYDICLEYIYVLTILLFGFMITHLYFTMVIREIFELRDSLSCDFTAVVRLGSYFIDLCSV